MKRIIALIFLLFFIFVFFEGKKISIGTLNTPLPGFWLILIALGGCLCSCMLLIKKEKREYIFFPLEKVYFLHILLICLTFLILFKFFPLYITLIGTLIIGYIPYFIQKKKKVN